MAGIQKKLRSERGASITFALLLFLVCAAVGSVILTVTGWKDSEGIAWTIPEEERVPRQWTRLFR